MGLVVHGMQGFDYDKARTVLKIPDGYQVEAGGRRQAGGPTRPAAARNSASASRRMSDGPVSQTGARAAWRLG